MKIVSWNVNGLRAAIKSGFLEFLESERPDVLCLQEIKATEANLAGTVWPEGYTVLWNSAQKPGYSGTATLVREEPLSVMREVGEPIGDGEGRALTVEFPGFYLVNVYTPNAQRELTRLDYKIDHWDPAFRRHLGELDAQKPVVFCGDLNVAHEEIDLKNPKSNQKNAGFTPQERASFSETLAQGYTDTFRQLHPGEPDHYSWWSYRANARARNIGWRIDYVCVSERLMPQVRSAFIRPQVMGSDHCPVGIELASV